MQRPPPSGGPVINRRHADPISPDAMPCNVRHAAGDACAPFFISLDAMPCNVKNRGCDEPIGAGTNHSRPRRSAPSAPHPLARVPAKPRQPSATACRRATTWTPGRPRAVRILPDAMPYTVSHATGDARAPAGRRFHLARRNALHREKSPLRRTDWRRQEPFSAAPIRAACAASGCPRTCARHYNLRALRGGSSVALARNDRRTQTRANSRQPPPLPHLRAPHHPAPHHATPVAFQPPCRPA